MKLLFVPVEVRARELTAKVLLAVHAARQGYAVVIGQSGAVQTVAMAAPPGVYLEKNINPRRAHLFARLRQQHHRLFAWDEEALAVLNYDWYVRKNIKLYMLDKVDGFLTCGDAETAAIRARHPSVGERLHVTGNVRTDLLREEYRSLVDEEGRAWNKEFGNYILINSSFSRVNRLSGTHEDFVAEVSRSFQLDGSETEFLRGSVTHAAALFAHFKTMIVDLAHRLPETTIVVRPHPAERAETWREVASGISKIRVANHGTAVGAISGANAVIHNGCTTAIEAFLLGRLPIAYRPVQSAEFDVELPNALSLTATTVDELVDLLSIVRSHSPTEERILPAYLEKIPRLQQAICSANGPTACSRILYAIDDIAPMFDETVDLKALGGRSTVQLISGGLKTRALSLARKLFRGRQLALTDDYREQKFLALSLGDMTAITDAVAALVPGRRPIMVETLMPNCFLLSEER